MKKKDHHVYLIKFDHFPADAQPVPISREHIKRVLHKDEEEPPSNRPEEEIIEGEDVDNTKEKHGDKRNYVAESIKAFVAMDAAGIKSANSFALCYGGKDSKVINWQILGEKEQIVMCPMEEKMKALSAMMTVSTPGARVASNPKQLEVNSFKKDIKWDPDPAKTDCNKIFFDHFFPSLKGKANVADRIISDPCCGIYNMIQRMQPFHQPDRDDPDEKVRTVAALCLTE